MEWSDLVSKTIGQFRERQAADKQNTSDLYRIISEGTGDRNNSRIDYVNEVPTFCLKDMDLFAFDTNEGQIRVRPIGAEEKCFDNNKDALGFMAELVARVYVPKIP